MTTTKETLSQMGPLQIATVSVVGFFVIAGCAWVGTLLTPMGPLGILLWAILALWATLPLVHLVATGWPATFKELFSGPANLRQTEGEDA